MQDQPTELQAASANPRRITWRILVWMLTGVALVSVMSCIAHLSIKSPGFASAFRETAETLPDRIYTKFGLHVPSLAMMLYILACVLLVLAIITMPRKKVAVWMLAFIAVVGAGMRWTQLDVPPTGGMDYHRYFLDGAMVAHGHNPYQYTPQDLLGMLKTKVVLNQDFMDKLDRSTLHPSPKRVYTREWTQGPVRHGEPAKPYKAGDIVSIDRSLLSDMETAGIVSACDQTQRQPPDPAFDKLIRENYEVIERCNHPGLRTPYPPLAQGMFVAGHAVSTVLNGDITEGQEFRSNKLRSLQLVMLLFDVLAAVMVLLLLRKTALPMTAWLVYVWNPVLVMEAFHSAHMELVVGALVALFAWCVVTRRIVLGSTVLSLAVAAKIWPIMLGVFLIRPALANRKRGLVGVAVFLALTCAVMIPYAGANSGDTAGPTAYQRTSHENYGMHYLLDKFDQHVLKPIGIHVGPDNGTATTLGDQGGRTLGMLLAGAGALWLGLKKQSPRPEVTCLRIGAVMMLFLLLSHTVYPWYYAGVMPLAAVCMRPSLLAWSVLAPLMYMPRALFPSLPSFEDGILMAIVHLPVWVLLAIDLLHRQNAGTAAAPPSVRMEKAGVSAAVGTEKADVSVGR